MNRLSRLAAVAALSVLAVAVPSAANAINYNIPAKAGPVSAATNDPAGDVSVVDGEGGAPTAAMFTGADIKQVQVKAKKSGLTVTVRGVDFPDAAVDRVGLMTTIGVETDGADVAASYFSGELAFLHEGVTSECAAVTAVYAETSNRLTFTVPASCLGGATKVENVDVAAWGFDLSGAQTNPTEDSAEVTKDLRLGKNAKGPKK